MTDYPPLSPADYPPLSTKVIGEAESALGALLAPLLAEAGLTFPQWVTLAIAAASGPAADHQQLLAQVAGARKLDPAEAAAAIAGLLERGDLAAEGGQLALTGAGQATRSKVQAHLEGVIARLFDFPAQDLATAGRVLTVLTARANSALTTL